MRQKPDTVACFAQFLAGERLSGTPSAIEAVRSDELEEFKGDFAKLCRMHSIRQGFTIADGVKFNGVAEHHIATVVPAGMAAQVQAQSLFQHSRFRLVLIAYYGRHATSGCVMSPTIRQL